MNEPVKFNIEQKQIEDIDCLNLSGYLDAHTAPELESKLEELINEGNIKIVVNFENLDYISSAGLGVFMAFIEDIRESGGDIKLAKMKSKVFNVFDLLGFPMLFDIEKEESDAVNKFKNKN